MGKRKSEKRGDNCHKVSSYRRGNGSVKTHDRTDHGSRPMCPKTGGGGGSDSGDGPRRSKRANKGKKTSDVTYKMK